MTYAMTRINSHFLTSLSLSPSWSLDQNKYTVCHVIEITKHKLYFLEEKKKVLTVTKLWEDPFQTTLWNNTHFYFCSLLALDGVEHLVYKFLYECINENL